jgi:hypothetical protein
MQFAPYANWELIGYVGLWLVLSISAGLMLEYFENRSKNKKNQRVQK